MILSSILLIRRLRRIYHPSIPTKAGSKVLLCVMLIVLIAIGAVHLHDCPRKRSVPIYLIVLGVFSLVLELLSCLPCAPDVSKSWNSLVSLFFLCLFIAGSVWIYSPFEPNYHKATADYCDRRVFLIAFWTITVTYILLGVFMVVSFFALICGWSHSDDDVDIVPGP